MTKRIKVGNNFVKHYLNDNFEMSFLMVLKTNCPLEQLNVCLTLKKVDS